MYNSITFGTVIKELRKERSLSQGELAKDICSQGMLSRIENNEVVPNVLVMQSLCQRLNVSVNYILTLQETPLYPKNNWLELLNYYKKNQEFVKLAETIQTIEADPQALLTKIEKQEFAFYKGISLYNNEADLNEVLAVLQAGLNLTYSRHKDIASEMEIILLSEIGNIYYQLGQFETGINFMKRSVAQFYSDLAERNRVELIKVFYNLASALIDLKCYAEAMEYIEQGLSWSQEKKTYFRLADLYYLKGIVLEAQNSLNEADEVVQIAMTLEKMMPVITK